MTFIAPEYELETPLSKLILTAQGDGPSTIDLEQSCFSISLIKKEVIPNREMENGDTSYFYVGDILRVSLKIKLDSPLAMGSRLLLMSTLFSSNKSIGEMPGILMKEKAKKNKQSFWNSWLLVDFLKNLLWVPEKEKGLSIPTNYLVEAEIKSPESLRKLDYVVGIDQEVIPPEEKAIVPLLKQEEKKSFDTKEANVYFFSFCPVEGKSEYVIKTSINSNGANLTNRLSEAFWLSIYHPDGLCETIPFRLPEQCFYQAIFLLAKPAYILIKTTQKASDVLVATVIGFARSDGENILIEWDAPAQKKSEHRLVDSIEKLRHDEVRITLNLKYLKKRGRVPRSINLTFYDGHSDGRLKMFLPIIIQK